MIKINDYEDFNLFESLYTLNSNLLIFEYISATNLDTAYKATNSNRILLPNIADMTIDNIAIIINVMFANKWDNAVKSIMNLQSDFMTNTETKVTVNSGTDTTTNTDVNQVSAYNDDDFVNNEQTNTNNIIEYGKTVTETTDSIKRQSITDDDMKLLLFNMITDILFKDVNSTLTLTYFGI